MSEELADIQRALGRLEGLAEANGTEMKNLRADIATATAADKLEHDGLKIRMGRLERRTNPTYMAAAGATAGAGFAFFLKSFFSGGGPSLPPH